MSKYVDFYLIGELVDSHGNVHYEDLKNLPTADVVPMEYHERCVTEEIRKRANMVEVVRCKDCVYWEKATDNSGNCNRAFEITAYGGDYCSYGERRE